MALIVPIFVIGLASSILTEIFKLFPALCATKSRKRVIAFVIAFLITLCWAFSQAEFAKAGLPVLLAASLGATFVIYKSVIQPIAGVVTGKVKLTKDN